MSDPKPTAERERDELLKILRGIVFRSGRGVFSGYSEGDNLLDDYPELGKWITGDE